MMSSFGRSSLPGAYQYRAHAHGASPFAPAPASAGGGGGPNQQGGANSSAPAGWASGGGSFGGGFNAVMVLLNDPTTKQSKTLNERTKSFTSYALFEMALAQHPSAATSLTPGSMRLTDAGATLEVEPLRQIKGAGSVPSKEVPAQHLRRGSAFRLKRFKALEQIASHGRTPQAGDLFEIGGVSCRENEYQGRYSPDWSMRKMTFVGTLASGGNELADQANASVQLYLPHQGPAPVPVRFAPGFNMAEKMGKTDAETGALLVDYVPQAADFKEMKNSQDESLKQFYYRNEYVDDEGRAWLRQLDGSMYVQLLPTPLAVERYMQSCATVREYVRWDGVPVLDVTSRDSWQFTPKEKEGGGGAGAGGGEDGGGGGGGVGDEIKPRVNFVKYGTVMRRDAETGEFVPARQFALHLEMWKEATRFYGMQEDFNLMQVLPVLFLVTPCTLKCYVDVAASAMRPVVPQQDEEESAEVERFELVGHVSTGTKEKPARGCYPDLPVGIVSAGLEVSADDVLAHMQYLSKRRPTRYSVDMRLVNGIDKIPVVRDNVLTQRGSDEVVNVLACRYEIAALAKTHRFFVVANWWHKEVALRPKLCEFLGTLVRETPKARAALFGKAFLECAQGDGRPAPERWMFGPVEKEDDPDEMAEAARRNKFQYAVFALSESLLRRRGLLDYYGNNAYVDVVMEQEAESLKARQPVRGAAAPKNKRPASPGPAPAQQKEPQVVDEPKPKKQKATASAEEGEEAADDIEDVDAKPAPPPPSSPAAKPKPAAAAAPKAKQAPPPAAPKGKGAAPKGKQPKAKATRRQEPSDFDAEPEPEAMSDE